MTSQSQCSLNCHWHSYQSRHARRFTWISAWALALLAIAPCLIAQSSTPAESIENARALVAANRLAQANEMLSALVSRDPNNLAAWQELGEVQLAQSLNDDAMKSFDCTQGQAGFSAGTGGEVHAAIASALASRNAGNADRALACLLRARGYVSESVELLIDFGIQADGMQIYKDADEALSKAHQLEPQNLRALYALAHVELDE